jgi:hypothetical protein
MVPVADIAIAFTVAIAVPFTLSVPLALALSFLVPMGHFFVLLDRSVSVVHVAVPVVWSTAWAKILAVHACLSRGWLASSQKTEIAKATRLHSLQLRRW